MMINHSFANPLPGIQIASYSQLRNYDGLVFPLEPHRPGISVPFAKAISSPPPVELGVFRLFGFQQTRTVEKHRESTRGLRAF
ncbi:MAG: hypothetical protein PUD50_06570, partial [Eubacteriales bacterium]|nr:hypothetical protein [Eubacteriales bacterium]